MTPPINHPKQRVAGRVGKKSAPGKTPAKLLVAMTGKASAAKTATGDEPVFAYIASLPQPQRGIAERSATTRERLVVLECLPTTVQVLFGLILDDGQSGTQQATANYESQPTRS